MSRKVIAYYLPQFHQIPENDKWWGFGYTEWTALKKWKSCFEGHQIRKPDEKKIGYYNLLNLDVIKKQYELAEKYNITGFCFWAYWFGGGARLLEKPLDLLLSQNNKIRYCVAWANHSWFDKSTWTMLQKQHYLGKEDYTYFFYTFLPHFKNPNYILDDGRPVFSLFMIQDIPDFQLYIETWNALAIKEGFRGMFFISDQYVPNFQFNHLLSGFSHSPQMFKNRNFFQKILERLIRYHSWHFLGPMKYSYPRMMKNLFNEFINVEKFIPTIFCGWDTTPRHGRRGVVLRYFNPTHFLTHVREIFSTQFKSQYVFVKSWNEWAEGNVLEPDHIHGEEYLAIMKKENN